MAWVDKQDMIRLLDSLKQITLDAYDGKIISRSDIEAQYRLIMQSVIQWGDNDTCAIVALANKKSASNGAEQKTNYEQYTISGRR